MGGSCVCVFLHSSVNERKRSQWKWDLSVWQSLCVSQKRFIDSRRGQTKVGRGGDDVLQYGGTSARYFQFLGLVNFWNICAKYQFLLLVKTVLHVVALIAVKALTFISRAVNRSVQWVCWIKRLQVLELAWTKQLETSSYSTRRYTDLCELQGICRPAARQERTDTCIVAPNCTSLRAENRLFFTPPS